MPAQTASLKNKKTEDITFDGDGDRYFIWKECKEYQGK